MRRRIGVGIGMLDLLSRDLWPRACRKGFWDEDWRWSYDCFSRWKFEAKHFLGCVNNDYG